MEISRDGRRVPELIDTSAPRSGCAGYTTHKLAGEQEKRVGKREREKEREIYTVVGARELVSRIEGPEFVRITRDLAHS